MMIGMALDTVNVPAATNPTVIEVVTELDCIIAVASIPINSPVKGFEVELIKTLAKPAPKPLREALKISIPKRNK
jgi:hypothetical protein